MFTEIQMMKLKEKFYMQARQFNKFDGIDKKILESIDKRIEQFEKVYLKDLKIHAYYKLEKYYTVIRYLAYNTEMSFDEKAIFLIKMCDPSCLIYNNYKALELTPLKVIEGITDEKEKAEKEANNEREIISYKNATRSQIGFFEAKLLKIEELYIKKLKKEFIPNCAKDYGDTLFIGDYDFYSIDQADYARIKTTVKDYLDTVDNPDLKTTIYHILYQNNLLGLRNLTEQLLFFILATDPNLEFLTIYYEECNWSYIKERSLLEHGYYSKHLFKVEENYAKAFEVQHKLNLWK